MPTEVELQDLAFQALDELCSSLTPEEWAMPTDCPGWDVKDNISHIIGTESSLLGRPAPEHDPGTKPHVRNPIGAGNEVQVDYRRSRTPEEVLAEFRDVTAERMKIIGAMTDDDLAGESWTPIGQGTVRDLLAIRVMDCWVHEQDIRRAVGKPGDLEGPLAEHAFARHSMAIPFVIGKKVGPPDATTFVYDVKGMGTIQVGMDGKRANPLDAPPSDATVKFTLDLETFNRLCCGRGALEELIPHVTVEGDEELGRKTLELSNFMI